MGIEKNDLPLVGRSKCRSEAEAFRAGGQCRPPPEALRASTSPQGGGDPSGGGCVVAIARAWIGTPYRHQASVKGVGCDCLGLLRGVWRELNGSEAEMPPPYAPDWAESTRDETLYEGLRRHLLAIERSALAPGDVALFRMQRGGPAKHCAVVGGRAGALTLVHARQNKRVSEEAFSSAWRRKLVFAFRLAPPGAQH
jgi:NlpC/P60 family putative phage cell wall peptidase